jgi:hypothetical protein
MTSPSPTASGAHRKSSSARMPKFDKAKNE